MLNFPHKSEKPSYHNVLIWKRFFFLAQFSYILVFVLTYYSYLIKIQDDQVLPAEATFDFFRTFMIIIGIILLAGKLFLEVNELSTSYYIWTKKVSQKVNFPLILSILRIFSILGISIIVLILLPSSIQSAKNNFVNLGNKHRFLQDFLILETFITDNPYLVLIFFIIGALSLILSIIEVLVIPSYLEKTSKTANSIYFNNIRVWEKIKSTLMLIIVIGFYGFLFLGIIIGGNNVELFLILFIIPSILNFLHYFGRLGKIIYIYRHESPI